jgi:hypothetical protein
MSIETLVQTHAHHQKCTQQKHNNTTSIIEKQKLINTPSNFLTDPNVGPKVKNEKRKKLRHVS